MKPLTAAGAAAAGLSSQARPFIVYGPTCPSEAGPPASGTVSTGTSGLASDTASTLATPRSGSTGSRPLIQYALSKSKLQAE